MARNAIGTTTAFYVLLVLMAPFFLFGIVEKDGLPLEEYLVNYIRHRFVYPSIRSEGYENIYDYYEERRKENERRKRSNGRAKGHISKQSQHKRQNR